MNTELRWGSGRRWFGAAVVLVTVMALVARYGPVAPAAAAFAGANGKIAYVSLYTDRMMLSTVEADGSNLVYFWLQISGDLYSPSWSPDGAQIAFSADEYVIGGFISSIYVMDADGTNLRALTSTSAFDNFQPAWSPDGNHISFVSDRDGNREIYVMNADGSEVQRLTTNSSDDSSPSWSADGTRIAFVRYQPQGQIYIMNPDGSDPINLSNNTANEMNPNWSPDGSWLAFDSDFYGNRDILVMASDGSHRANLTNEPGYLDDHVPVWSPDGTKIAFLCGRIEYRMPGICVMGSDGSDPVQLDNTGGASDLDWQTLPQNTFGCPAGDPHVASAYTTLLGSGMAGTATPVNKVLSIPNVANLTALYAQYAGKDFGLLPSQVVFKTAKETITQTAPASPAYRFGAVHWFGTPLQVPVSSARVSVWDQFLKPAERTPRAFLLYATHRKPAAYYDVSAQLADSRANHVYWEADKGWIAGQQVAIDIPVLSEARDITIQAAVVDNDRDTRLFKLTASAGGVKKTVSAAAPNKGNMLNLVTIKLIDVPAGTDQIVLDLVSPPNNGDSVALVGYTLHYACEE